MSSPDRPAPQRWLGFASPRPPVPGRASSRLPIMTRYAPLSKSWGTKLALHNTPGPCRHELVAIDQLLYVRSQGGQTVFKGFIGKECLG